MFRDRQPWKMKSVYLPDRHRINSCKSRPLPRSHIHTLCCWALGSDLWDSRSADRRQLRSLARSALGQAWGDACGRWGACVLRPSGAHTKSRLQVGAASRTLSGGLESLSGLNKPILIFARPCARPWQCKDDQPGPWGDPPPKGESHEGQHLRGNGLPSGESFSPKQDCPSLPLLRQRQRSLVFPALFPSGLGEVS